MEYPKMTSIEYDLNMHQLSKVLKNVPPHIRDLLIYHLNKMDLHVQALEDELRRVNNGETIRACP